MNLNYSKIGHGLPIIFLHGWGFNSTIWNSLTYELSANYTIYSFDLPGFGETPLMDWQMFKDKLLKILPKKFVVIGWSMGGLFGTRLALEEPERVNKLLLINSSPHFIKEEQINWPGIDKRILMNFADKLEKNPNKTLKDFIKLQLKDVNCSTFTSDDTWQKIGNFMYEGLEEGLKILCTWDFKDDLKYIKIPTYFLFGKLDAIVPAEVAVAVKIRAPHIETIVLPKAAHALFLSHKKEFLEIFYEKIFYNRN